MPPGGAEGRANVLATLTRLQHARFTSDELGRLLEDLSSEVKDLDPDSDEAQRLTGIALGRKGDEAEGFYHLALASRLRGELEQALSQFQHTDRLVTPGSARQAEVERAIAELEPLVRERARERQERRRTGRRGLGTP